MSAIIIDSNSEFFNTYKLYREYINYSKPLTYNKWMRLPQSFKIAALYCQFYNEITLAWYKVKTPWSIEEEGIETINQYLSKNISKIEADKKRFDPKYIYKVAYNCFYCICIDPTKNKDRYHKEVSERFEAGDDEISWFDFLGDDFNFEDSYESEILQNFFNQLSGDLQLYLEFSLGEVTECQVVRSLKNQGYITGNTRDKSYRQKVIQELSSYAPEKIKIKLSTVIDIDRFV